MASLQSLFRTLFYSNNVYKKLSNDQIQYWVNVFGRRSLSISTTASTSSNSYGMVAPIDVLGQWDANNNPLYDSILNNNFNTPLGISGQGSGVIDYVNHRLWIPDVCTTGLWGGNRILGWQLDSNDQRTSDTPNWVLGQPDFYANSNRCDRASLNNAGHCQIAWSDHYQCLFVPDPKNNRVVIWDLSAGIVNGMDAKWLWGQSDWKSNTADGGGTIKGYTFNNPTEIQWDEANRRLFLVDDGNSRILIFDLSKGIYDNMCAINVLGQTDLVTGGSTNPPTASKFWSPEGLYWWPAKNWLFSVQNRHSRVIGWDLTAGVTNGQAATMILGTADFTFTNPAITPCTNASLNACRFAWADEARSIIWVSDQGNNRVLGFDVSGGLINGMAATYIIGQTDFVTSTSGLSSSKFNDPEAVLYNKTTKELLIGDVNNKRYVGVDTTNLASIATFTDLLGGQVDYNTNVYSPLSPCVNGGLKSSYGIAVDTIHWRLFVADNVQHRIQVFLLNSDGSLKSKTASFVIGQANFTSNSANQGGAANNNTLNNPWGIFYDSARNYLWVCDGNNNRVLAFDMANLATNMAATYVLFQPDFTTTSTGLTSSKCNTPFAVYVDSSSRVFVAENANNRVTVTDISGGISNGMPATNVLGQVDFTHNNQAWPSATALKDCIGVTADETNHIVYVSEFSGNRVMYFDITLGITDNMPATKVIGQPNFSSNSANQGSSTPLQNTFSGAQMLAISTTTNELFCTDQKNRRALGFRIDTVATNMLASNVLGEPDFIGTAPLFNASFKYTVGYINVQNANGLAIDNVNSKLWLGTDGGRVLQYKL